MLSTCFLCRCLLVIMLYTILQLVLLQFEINLSMCSSFVSWSLQLKSIDAKTSCTLQLFCFAWRNQPAKLLQLIVTFLCNVLTFYTPMDEEKRLTNDKGITMAQRKVVNQNNSFVNPPRLPFTHKISGALHLVEPGFMAGRHSLA